MGGNFPIDGSVNISGTSSTSISLLERAKANDQAAWKTLCELCLPLVHSWCRRAGVHPAHHADLGQEVLLAAVRNLGTFRREQSSDTFRGWLRSITNSKIADLFRNREQASMAVGGSSAQRYFAHVEFENSPDAISEDKAILFARAIELISCEFPEWYKTAFLRLVMEQHAAADIAADLGKRVSAVHNAKARVIKRLREEFSELLD